MNLRLPVVPGIDAEQATLRLDGKINIYLKLLAIFRQEYGNVSIALALAAANKNYAEMNILLHSLRGAAGNLSMFEVYAAATAAELWLMEEACSNEQAPALIILLDQLASRLQEADDSITQLLAFIG